MTNTIGRTLSPLLAKRLNAARERRAPPSPPAQAIPADQATATKPAPGRSAPKSAAGSKQSAPPQAAAKQVQAIQNGGEPCVDADAADVPLVAYLRSIATRQDVIRYVTDEQLLAVWLGMVDGGGKVGHIGSADRQAFCRLVGLPISASGQGGIAASGQIIVGDRLERAASRANGLRRHVGVTAGGLDVLEPAEVLGSAEVEHQFVDPVPVPARAKQPSRREIEVALGMQDEDEEGSGS